MRIREYLVGARFMAILFATRNELTKYNVVERLKFVDCPEDAWVHHIALAPHGMCWSIFMEHPSFEDVSESVRDCPSGEVHMEAIPILHADGGEPTSYVLNSKSREHLIALRDKLTEKIDSMSCSVREVKETVECTTVGVETNLVYAGEKNNWDGLPDTPAIVKR